MTAKEYLSRAYLLDQQIVSKLEQVQSLQELACKITSGMDIGNVSGTKDPQRMENLMVKLMDLQNEISLDAERLVEVKLEIMEKINTVKNSTHRLLLELRYLSGKDWSVIADKLGYDLRYTHKIHAKSLKEIQTGH